MLCLFAMGRRRRALLLKLLSRVKQIKNCVAQHVRMCAVSRLQAESELERCVLASVVSGPEFGFQEWACIVLLPEGAGKFKADIWKISEHCVNTHVRQRWLGHLQILQRMCHDLLYSKPFVRVEFTRSSYILSFVCWLAAFPSLCDFDAYADRKTIRWKRSEWVCG